MVRNIVALYLFVAVVFSSFFAFCFLSKAKALRIKVFSVFCLCVSIYLFGYLLELNSEALDHMIFWNSIQNLALPFIPALWIIVALLYTNRIIRLDLKKGVIILIIPLITFIMRITNPYHSLYYSSMSLHRISDFPILYIEKGPWYCIQMLYLLIVFITTTFLFYKEYRVSDTFDKSKFAFFTIISLIPYLGIILIFIDFMDTGLDYSALILPLVLFLISRAIRKYDFLDIKATAREVMFDKSPDALIVMDNNSRITDYNKTARALFSIPDVFTEAITIEELLNYNADLIDVFKNESTKEFRWVRDGQPNYYEIKSSSVRHLHGKEAGKLKTIRDITENKLAHDEIRLLANTDELSGINNRKRFLELSQQEYDKAKRNKGSFCVIMSDIDNFKDINDTMGHAAGDDVIREIGQMMKTNFRKTDIIGRLGGEEFCVLLNNITKDDAKQAAEQFRKRVELSAIKFEDTDISITISSGVSFFDPETRDFDAVLRLADNAMYAAKAMGRNCVVTADDINCIDRELARDHI